MMRFSSPVMVGLEDIRFIGKEKHQLLMHEWTQIYGAIREHDVGNMIWDERKFRVSGGNLVELEKNSEIRD